MKENQ